MIKNIKYLAVMAVLCFAGCKRRDTASLQQLKNEDITVQVMKIADDNDKTMLTYKARVMPAKQLLEGKTTADKTAMFYHMDSCFYLKIGNTKTYANLIQPVANGISDTYEYLIEFEKDDKMNTDSVNLVYTDKHLTKKDYTIKVTE